MSFPTKKRKISLKRVNIYREKGHSWPTGSKSFFFCRSTDWFSLDEDTLFDFIQIWSIERLSRNKRVMRNLTIIEIISFRVFFVRSLFKRLFFWPRKKIPKNMIIVLSWNLKKMTFTFRFSLHFPKNEKGRGRREWSDAIFWISR